MIAAAASRSLAATAATGVSDALGALGAAVEAARPLGVAGGVLLAVAGLAALTVATRFRRALAVTGGAAVGALAALSVRGLLASYLGLAPEVAVALAAAAGAAACGAYPLAFPIAAGALPGVLLGGTVPLAGRAALGAAAGGAIGAVIGAGFARLVTAAFASLVGGAALVVGLAVALGRWAPAQGLLGRPMILAAVGLVAAVAGAAFQLARGDRAADAPPPLRVPGR